MTADTWQAWGRLAYTVTGSGLTMTLSRVTADQGSPLVGRDGAHPHRHGDRGHHPLSVQVVGLERERLVRCARLGDRQHSHLDAAGPRQLRGPRLGPQQRRDRGHLASVGTLGLHGAVTAVTP